MPEEKKEMSLELRVLLAFALSAVILVLFSPKQKPPAQPATPPPVAKTEPVKQAETPSPAAPAGKTGKAAGAKSKDKTAVPAPAAPAALEPTRVTTESEMAVENDLYAVRFSNQGGVVRSWVVKAFKDNQGQPLDLVRRDTVKELGAPLTFWTPDAALRDKLGQALFEAKLSSPRAPATLTFEYRDSEVVARKEFQFQHGSYVVLIRSELTRNGTPLPHELAWRGGFGDHTIHQSHLAGQITLSAGGKHQHLAAGDVKGETRPPGPFTFVTLEDLFFAAVFMPTAGSNSVPGAVLFKNNFKPAPDKDPLEVVGLAAGGGSVNSFRAYIGPKDMDILGKIMPDPEGDAKLSRGEAVQTLAELIDFGWFSFVALPLFIALKWIYVHIVANYGWAIILLTVLINFALFPLKLTSMKSAMKMQRIAPQVAAINEKYKKYKLTDPRQQEKNAEVMALYKKHGVNPVGGCLPVVLQIPFLYGFYKVLSLSIEMRHAPWILWVQDLSRAETHWLKVLPLLMIVTTVVLQKMTPQTSTDPVQQKMFMLMPLMFGVMFYNVSSGLVLYWLVGNLVQIAQQWYISKTDTKRKMAEE